MWKSRNMERTTTTTETSCLFDRYEAMETKQGNNELHGLEICHCCDADADASCRFLHALELGR